MLPLEGKSRGISMQFVANFEIKTETSIINDDLILRFEHPNGLYRVLMRNIPRSEYTIPFLLSLHLYFEASELNEAQEVAEELLTECLNMLSFTTGSKFMYHRIRQIVDASSESPVMRSVIMWADQIKYEDPQPFLDEKTKKTIEQLLEHDISPAIQRAMKWYRLGVNERVPDDQFMYFWFAIEIIAEFQKPSDKVSDRCPHCQSSLYCETCEKHPAHKPYAKQAIRALLKSVDQECDDSTIESLEKTRNSLMHGSILREIEDSLPEPHEEIVDVLGRLLWKALIHQFPKEIFDGTLILGYPSTYINRTLKAATHLETIVSTTPEGDFNLDFSGFQAKVIPFGPPQSASPRIINMTTDQYERLGQLRPEKKDQQEIRERILQRVEIKGGTVFAMVLSTDDALIKKSLKEGNTSAWQDLFREIYSAV